MNDFYSKYIKYKNKYINLKYEMTKSDEFKKNKIIKIINEINELKKQVVEKKEKKIDIKYYNFTFFINADDKSRKKVNYLLSTLLQFEPKILDELSYEFDELGKITLNNLKNKI